MRIRRRLVLYGIAVATLGMLLFAVLLGGLLSGGVAEEQATLLDEIAASTAVAASTLDPASLADREPLERTDLGTSTEPFALILTADGAVLYATGTLDSGPPAIPAAVLVEALRTGRSAAMVTLAPGVDALVAARSWTNGEETGVVVAGRSTAFIAEQLAGFRAFLFIAAIITITVVAIVTWMVVGRALRPLRTLAVTTDEIARTGDLSRRLPAVRTRDEVGALTASFNAMLERLQGAQVALSEALAGQRRFVADASHELRTPLTSIRANAGFLRDRVDAAAVDRVAAIADIDAEAERLARLVDDLLLLARTDADPGSTMAIRPRRPVDLAAIAADVVRVAGRTDRPVRAEIDGRAVVEGDPEALMRLVWILVDNGLRHGAGPVEVRTRMADDGRVELVVQDDGPGIAAGEEERIFDRFHRSDAARSGPGAGLGLSIARAIIAEHGGTIESSTRPEGGARFTVRLPNVLD